MKPFPHFPHLIACIALAVPATCSIAGPGTITITADEADNATDQSMTYGATCLSGKYQIRLLQRERRVEFVFEGATRTTVDISDTSVGAVFLRIGAYGKFESTCPANGLRVHFYGFEPRTGATPKAVSYHFTLSNSGQVVRDSGVTEEAADSINYRINPRNIQQ